MFSNETTDIETQEQQSLRLTLHFTQVNRSKAKMNSSSIPFARFATLALFSIIISMTSATATRTVFGFLESIVSPRRMQNSNHRSNQRFYATWQEGKLCGMKESFESWEESYSNLEDCCEVVFAWDYDACMKGAQ